MKNYDEKVVLNSHLVIKIEINRIRKIFVKLMSVKKFSYVLRTIHTGFEKVCFSDYFDPKFLFFSEDSAPANGITQSS